MTGKEILKTGSFLSIFLLITIALTYILRTNGEVKDIFTGFYAEEKNSIDVIMIGSSPVYPFYAAPQLWGEYGITAYPLSSHVQRPSAALPLLKEAYKYQTPAVVVFEMRMFTMEDGDMESNMAFARGVTDNMKYSLNRVDAVNRLVADRRQRYTYYFDIFKYHSNWRSIVLPEQLACIIYEKKHPLKGFAIKNEVGPLEPELIPDCSGISALKPIPREQEERLEELLLYLKEKKQQALFIVSPYRVEEEEQKMFNYMAAIIEKEGFSFVNLNNYYGETGIDFTTDFYDYGGHVNTLGAVKCTTFLGDILSRDFRLTNRRRENEGAFKAYDGWEAAYQRYRYERDASVNKITSDIENQIFAER